ncbi:hypothetical protein CVO77_03870 [Sphingopyxis lindanitolerans]|uniref:Lipoprotein n=1 Tax=Sphingopyxis lindanitolerans TaxID=2054227 RepID=A0A2S8B5M5_9SPHN|nr:hypothetical protein [Sphingopyxis lindanitolerans]PQM27712.1 hypothetical protein CVO77_03870 [Sphingopyxis lindanitolerans]
MHADPYRKAAGRGRARSLAIALSLTLGGCGGAPADATLPADRSESAALCYGATMALAKERIGSGSVPVDDAGQALHFALLGGSPDGLGDPAKFEQIASRGATLQHKFVADKNAASYTAPCAKAFPETQAGAFKALPPDVRDTRIMCYTLSTVLLQIFAQSEIAPDPRAATYVKLNGALERLVNSEVYPAEDDEHVGEIAMRALAKAVRLGPPIAVLNACSDRYLKR